MNRTALIIVDMQYDFLPGGSLAVENGDEIVPIINNLQNNYDIVVATQDWHPEEHYSFASSHPEKVPFEMIQMDGQDQVLWPDHCVQGTRGAELIGELDWRKVSAIFRKGMDQEVDSYSGFFDNHRKHKTGMAGYLRDLNVTDIYVAGLAADYCVYFTARDGQELGFRTHFIKNATREISRSGYTEALTDLLGRGVEIVNG